MTLGKLSALLHSSAGASDPMIAVVDCGSIIRHLRCFLERGTASAGLASLTGRLLSGVLRPFRLGIGPRRLGAVSSRHSIATLAHRIRQARRGPTVS